MVQIAKASYIITINNNYILVVAQSVSRSVLMISSTLDSFSLKLYSLGSLKSAEYFGGGSLHYHNYYFVAYP